VDPSLTDTYIYVTSFYFISTTAATIGYGDYGAKSAYEMYFMIFVQFIGMMVFSIFSGTYK
jgi:Ion channel